MSTIADQEQTKGQGFALAAVCIVAVAFNLRLGIVSMAPLLPAVREDFGLSYRVTALLIAIPDLLMGALALFTPWLSRRFGRDRAILAALMLLLIATAARAFVPSTSLLLLTTCGVGAGIATAGALIANFVKTNFPARAALMMSFYATALSLGSTAAAAATAPIAALGGGWRVGAGVWSFFDLFAIAAWLFIERRTGGSKPRNESVQRYPFPIRSGKAWLVAVFFALDNLIFYALLSSIAPMYRERGWSPSEAGFLLATFTGGVMVGSLILGAVSRNVDRRRLLAVSGALCVGGTLLIGFVPGVSAFLSIGLVALGVGGGFALGMTLPLDNARDPDEASVWNAFTLAVGYLLAAAGPVAIGALRDVTGDFDAATTLLLALSVALLALCPFLKPQDAHDRVLEA